MDHFFLRANEPQRARSDAFGAFSCVTHNKNGLAERRASS